MKEFAELCGISERYLADIERGYKAPRLDTLIRIANISGISTDYLLQDSLDVNKGKENDILNSLQELAPEQRKLICELMAQFAATQKK